MEDILVIDDDKHILRLVDEILTHRGYNVKTADNGIEGISLFEQNRRFSLVITDIRMPEADGNQVAKYMKDKDDMKNTPIIAISSYPNDAERELFDSILEKPFGFKELTFAVDSLYRKYPDTTAGQI